jgi:hypothetical protein
MSPAQPYASGTFDGGAPHVAAQPPRLCQLAACLFPSLLLLLKQADDASVALDFQLDLRRQAAILHANMAKTDAVRYLGVSAHLLHSFGGVMGHSHHTDPRQSPP